ncbi:unnamed protein product, partial [Effrenium voratum]
AEVERNNIRVAVRVRPFSEKELGDGCEPVFEVVEASVIAKGIDRFGNDSEFASGKTYTFDSVFSLDPTKGSQAQVFQELGIPILENAMDAARRALGVQLL